MIEKPEAGAGAVHTGGKEGTLRRAAKGLLSSPCVKTYWQPGSPEPAKRKAINTTMETAIKLLDGFGLGRGKCGPMVLGHQPESDQLWPVA